MADAPTRAFAFPADVVVGAPEMVGGRLGGATVPSIVGASGANGPAGPWRRAGGRAARSAFRSGGLALRASIMHLQACGGPEGLILGAAAIASGGV